MIDFILSAAPSTYAISVGLRQAENVIYMATRDFNVSTDAPLHSQAFESGGGCN